MKDAGKITQGLEQYFVHCFFCGTTKDLMMQPHRIDGKMVGWVFVCAECEHLVIGKNFVLADPQPQGKALLYQKYVVTRTDGREIPDQANLFVLRLDTDMAARAAMKTYAQQMEKSGEVMFAEQIYDMLESYSNS